MTDATAPITVQAPPRSLLRTALLLDAFSSGANGVAYLVAAGPLEDALGLSSTLLRATGAFFVVYGAAVFATAPRTPAPRPIVAGIIAGNAVWAVGSIVAAIVDWGSPTTGGTVWVVLQALIVAGFAELQLTGLRRARTA